ncbi:Aldo/keto reductase [Pluteus cervinus]|uniref:Aldo/keto reductase n=1 Tax=Pluteus cervinus TaxID=181527 RepID=A0ACD3A2J8_9AGAR|nr:Aldo/keto reductase [Pluteus cervinus]
MTWDLIKLNDGNYIPTIGFGTWKIPQGDTTVSQVDQALTVGFSHVDTAQMYRNEQEAGAAIRGSGLSRSEIFITTKYSGVDGLDIPTSIQNSLKNLGVEYVDLYLIHHPRLARPDIPTAWAQLEEIKQKGLAKSIGVSNFGVGDIEILLASAKVKPAVNQIQLHPYVYRQQLPILEQAIKHGIVIEAYSPLIPVTQRPGGPVEGPIRQISERLKVTTDQVLLAWAKSKGAVVLTTSSKKYRLEGYLRAGDLALTDGEIAAIDEAGGEGARRWNARRWTQRLALTLFGGAVALGLCSYLGIDLI